MEPIWAHLWIVGLVIYAVVNFWMIVRAFALCTRGEDDETGESEAFRAWVRAGKPREPQVY